MGTAKLKLVQGRVSCQSRNEISGLGELSAAGRQKVTQMSINAIAIDIMVAAD
jgi:hypothetical protein